MEESLFNNGHPGDNRQIRIIIDEDFIRFFYEEYYQLRKIFISDEEERRFQMGEDDMTEEQKSNDEFYGFDKDRWHHPKEGFPNHMMRKMWFTKDMLDFINCNVQK